MFLIHLLIYIFSLIGFSLVAVVILNYIADSIELKKARKENEERRVANEKNKEVYQERRKKTLITLANLIEQNECSWCFKEEEEERDNPQHWVYSHYEYYNNHLIEIWPSIQESGKTLFDWCITYNNSTSSGQSNTLNKAKAESLVALKEEARKIIDL